MENEQVEPSVSRNNRLYFHGTGGSREEFLKQHGLLAVRSFMGPAFTLSSSLESAWLYGSTKAVTDKPLLLTFWYPRKTETGRYKQSAEPTILLASEHKDSTIQSIRASNFSDDEKEKIVRSIEKAEKYLPPSRLGGIAVLTNEIEEQVKEFEKYCQSEGVLIVNNREELSKKVNNIFGNVDFSYLSEGLTKDQILEDIVRVLLNTPFYTQVIL